MSISMETCTLFKTNCTPITSYLILYCTKSLNFLYQQIPYTKSFFCCFFKVTLYKRTILHLSLLHFNVQYVGLRYMYSSYIQLLWMYDESQVVWNCSEFMRKHGKCEVSNSRSSPGEKKELMLFHVLSILVRELNLFFLLSDVWLIDILAPLRCRPNGEIHLAFHFATHPEKNTSLLSSFCVVFFLKRKKINKFKKLYKRSQ